MPDSPDAATARALLEAKREAFADGMMRRGVYFEDAKAAALVRYPDPESPAPKRLGLLTDEELKMVVGHLRHEGSHVSADFLHAVRTLAGEITPEMIVNLQRMATNLEMSWGGATPDLLRQAAALLARLAGLPATEEG